MQQMLPSMLPAWLVPVVLPLLLAMPFEADGAPAKLPSSTEGFAFMTGEWRVHHEQLAEPLSGQSATWKKWEGGASFFQLLGGAVCIEELRGPDNKPLGAGIRTFDLEKRTWTDRWIPAASGVMQDGVEGRFLAGRAVFEAKEQWKGQEIVSRGVWVRLSDDEVTWEQSASTDNGKTFESNWRMRFVRIKAR